MLCYFLLSHEQFLADAKLKTHFGFKLHHRYSTTSSCIVALLTVLAFLNRGKAAFTCWQIKKPNKLSQTKTRHKDWILAQKFDRCDTG